MTILENIFAWFSVDAIERAARKAEQKQRMREEWERRNAQSMNNVNANKKGEVSDEIIRITQFPDEIAHYRGDGGVNAEEIIGIDDVFADYHFLEVMRKHGYPLDHKKSAANKVKTKAYIYEYMDEYFLDMFFDYGAILLVKCKDVKELEIEAKLKLVKLLNLAYNETKSENIGDIE